MRPYRYQAKAFLIYRTEKKLPFPDVWHCLPALGRAFIGSKRAQNTSKKCLERERFLCIGYTAIFNSYSHNVTSA